MVLDMVVKRIVGSTTVLATVIWSTKANTTSSKQDALQRRGTVVNHMRYTTAISNEEYDNSTPIRTTSTSSGIRSTPSTSTTDAGKGLFTPVVRNVYFQEVTAATVAAALIVPAMTIIDRAIIRSQFQKTSLLKAKSSLMKELMTGTTRWNPALGIMFKVYGSTYLTANLTEAACESLEIDPVTPTTVFTTLVNCAMIAWKDKEYSKLYNTKNLDKFPRISYGLFALRDGLTVVASFNLKHKVRHYLQDEQGFGHNEAEIISSFAVPMAAQFFTTPLHILAIDIFNNPMATFRERLGAIRCRYVPVCSGLMLRIIPAFGVGGYINDVINEGLAGQELH